MNVLRFDHTTGDWVVFAPLRRLRPHRDKAMSVYAGDILPDTKEFCPFCPGNEHFTPRAIRELTDSEGASGVTASDDWTASSSKKSKSKTNAQPAATSGGAMEWILTNATVSSVTAIGRESTTGAADGEMEATIDAQQITFTM